MSDVVIPYRFKVLGNTAANLAVDPGIAKERELVVEIDTGRMKLGDGSTGYTALPYMGWGHADFTDLADKKVMAWNATGSKFAPVFLNAVDITYGVGNVDVALDDLFDALSDTVEEAPIDGKQYGRKDGEWVEITGGGGGGVNAGSQVGYSRTVSNIAASTTSSIPMDSSIPQNTEGTAYPSLDTSITPTASDSLLEVEVTIPYLVGTVASHIIGAVFRDSNADAIAVGVVVSEASDRSRQLTVRTVVVAGSTDETTFSFRFGTSSGTAYLLRSTSGAITFGGAASATMTVREIAQ